MAFTLTKYIYPLKEPILLSKHLGYTLDNPRTEDEIQFVKDYIHPALKRHYESNMPNYNPMLSAAFAISNWTKFMEGRNEFVYEYLKKNYQTDVLDIISQCWIIFRYSDNGEFEKAQKDKNIFFDIFFSDARYAYWEKYNFVLSYCQLISLLIHDDGEKYAGDSLILLEKPQDIFYPIDNTHKIVEAFQTFHGNCGIGNENRRKTWNYFPDCLENLISFAATLECKLTAKSELQNKKQFPKEKLLFIGDLLRVIENETHDVKVKILLLVSIIEFLVARNPDTNRFNIEDSISRQFVLKASILIYNENKERNLDDLKKNLKIIYDQRSKVAHGNHISTEDQQKMLDSFYSLYDYIRAIIIEYFKDPNFVDYLKES
jgi:hypothetical protein